MKALNGAVGGQYGGGASGIVHPSGGTGAAGGVGVVIVEEFY